jgi:hypothetical protein
MVLSVLPRTWCTTILVIVTCISLEASGQKLSVPADSVLAALLETNPDSFLRQLELRRAPAVNEQAKARIWRALPAEGRVMNLSDSDRAKIDALQPVLRLHNRDNVYDVLVIDVSNAFTGLHARAIVMISKHALQLLDKSELQGAVAHEAGHEYFWGEFQQARRLKDVARLQELELYCDAIAILTLVRLGSDPAQYMSGIEKIIRWNREKLGAARNESDYPPVGDRQRFAKAIREWTHSSVPSR